MGALWPNRWRAEFESVDASHVELKIAGVRKLLALKVICPKFDRDHERYQSVEGSLYQVFLLLRK